MFYVVFCNNRKISACRIRLHNMDLHCNWCVRSIFCAYSLNQILLSVQYRIDPHPVFSAAVPCTHTNPNLNPVIVTIIPVPNPNPLTLTLLVP